MENSYLKLTKTDKQILNSYCTFAKGLGQYLGEAYEIVVHSLASLDQSVIKIIHGFHSGRKEGAPITDLALQMLGKLESNSESALVYINKSKTGVPIKSATIPLIAENGRIIGLMCMNLYTDTPFYAFLSGLLPRETTTFHADDLIPETFSENIDELISNALFAAKESVLGNTQISSANKNKEIVALLYEKGIFNLKDSVIKVAALLNISKNTVYMHLRNLQAN